MYMKYSKVTGNKNNKYVQFVNIILRPTNFCAKKETQKLSQLYPFNLPHFLLVLYSAEGKKNYPTKIPPLSLPAFLSPIQILLMDVCVCGCVCECVSVSVLSRGLSLNI